MGADSGYPSDDPRRPLNVLLVEDNPDDVRLLRRALVRDRVEDIHLVHVARLSDALLRLAKDRLDAVLLDLSLPDSTGLDTLRQLRAMAGELPIVVLTGHTDEALGLRSLHEGAQDYLVKGQADGRLLDRGLRYAIERHHVQRQGRLLLEEQAARAAAVEALRARDEFLSVAAHELYTPITSLKLSAESLLADLSGGGPADPGHPADAGPRPVQRQLQIIERQTERLERLVKNLLEVSRIHVGHFELMPERVDLAALVHDVAAALGPQLARSSSTLTVHGDPSLWGTWDPGRLEQVVINLLSNAIKYGAGRPIEITFGGDADSATLVVSDRGIGIAQEMQERIFERFERAVPSRSFGGLGLGLYVVQRIVLAHGGTIELESQHGQGATFTVRLPRSGPSAAVVPFEPEQSELGQDA
jgi:signal transduction histidine kinase